VTDKERETMTDQELIQAIGQVVETVVEAKLEPIRQDIHGLKEDVRSLKDEVQTLKEDVHAMKGEVQALKEDVQTLKEDVQSLKGEVQELQHNFGQLESKVYGIRIYMDTEQKRTLNLLLEGQQALWDRFVPHEEFGPLEDRTEVLELTVKRHSKEIRELQLA